MIPQIEHNTFVMQAMSMGTRVELLDLIDYAKKNNGSVPIEHLYDELKSLALIDGVALSERDNAYTNAYKGVIELYDSQNNQK